MPRAGLWSRLAGSDLPNGTVPAAVKLLAQGEIDNGRELLRRICKHEPHNFDAHVFLAFDYLRKPENQRETARLLKLADAMSPNRPEVKSVLAIGSYFALTPEGLKVALESFSAAESRPPQTASASILFMLAQVVLSDALIQMACRPLGESISGVHVQPAVRGAAAFMQRNLNQAMIEFESSPTQLSQMVDSYERLFTRKLSEDERELILRNLRRSCCIGRALVYRERGEHDRARREWETAAETMPPQYFPILRLLIEEQP